MAKSKNNYQFRIESIGRIPCLELSLYTWRQKPVDCIRLCTLWLTKCSVSSALCQFPREACLCNTKLYSVTIILVNPATRSCRLYRHMMSRVIVCKLGRLGELRKIVDCQMNQLVDGKSDTTVESGQVRESTADFNSDLATNNQIDMDFHARLYIYASFYVFKLS